MLMISSINFTEASRFLNSIIERLPNENEDKTKTQMTQSFNQYSENEIKICHQNVPNQLNLCLHLVLVLIS